MFMDFNFTAVKTARVVFREMFLFLLGKSFNDNFLASYITELLMKTSLIKMNFLYFTLFKNRGFQTPVRSS